MKDWKNMLFLGVLCAGYGFYPLTLTAAEFDVLRWWYVGIGVLLFGMVVLYRHSRQLLLKQPCETCGRYTCGCEGN